MRPCRYLRARFIAVVIATAAKADDVPSRYGISIYNAASSNPDALFEANDNDAGAPGGYAVVRDRRQFELKVGTNPVQVRDVSRWLDPGAVSLRVLGDAGGADILDQRFENEPVSLDALVQRHFGHNVEIVPAGNAAIGAPISGTLLANVGGLTVQTADGPLLTTVTEFSRVTFPDLPRGLAATPALRWDIAAKKAGTQGFEIVYPTQGLAWRAEYSAWIVPGADCKVDFCGMGTDCRSQRQLDFRGAHGQSLIAGEPHRANQQPRARMMMAKTASSRALTADESGNAGDYHENIRWMRRSTCSAASLLRVALFRCSRCPCPANANTCSNLRACTSTPGWRLSLDRAYRWR